MKQSQSNNESALLMPPAVGWGGEQSVGGRNSTKIPCRAPAQALEGSVMAVARKAASKRTEKM